MADRRELPNTLTVEEAGEMLGISRRSAHRAAARGDLPTLRLGRRLLVPTARLLALLGVGDNVELRTPHAVVHSFPADSPERRRTTSPCSTWTARPSEGGGHGAAGSTSAARPGATSSTWAATPTASGCSAARASLARPAARPRRQRLRRPSKHPLAAFLANEWLPAMQPRLRATTRTEYKRKIDVQIAPRIGPIALQQLTPSHLNDFYAELMSTGRSDGASGLSPKTVHEVHVILRKALGDAARWGKVERNVGGLADPPSANSSVAVRRRAMRTWTAEELRRFLRPWSTIPCSTRGCSWPTPACDAANSAGCGGLTSTSTTSAWPCASAWPTSTATRSCRSSSAATSAPPG